MICWSQQGGSLLYAAGVQSAAPLSSGHWTGSSRPDERPGDRTLGQALITALLASRRNARSERQLEWVMATGQDVLAMELCIPSGRAGEGLTQALQPDQASGE